MQELIDKIRQQILYETVTESNVHEEQILKDYKTVLSLWVNNYALYREHSGDLLYTFEKHSDKSISYSLFIFQKLFAQALNYPIQSIFSDEIVDIEPTKKAGDNLEKILENSKSENLAVRISDFNLNMDGISTDEIKEIISWLIGKFQNDSFDLTWDLKQVESSVFALACLRALCVEIKEFEMFYHVVNMVFDKLYTSEYHQEARDLCEEVLIASIKDGFAFYGFFTCFKVYSNDGSVQAALLYGNLFLTSIIQDKSISSDKFRFEIIWQSLKFFRNCHLYPWAINLYEDMPNNLSLTIYQQHSLDLTYYTCKLLMKDKLIATSLNDYLNKERENILIEGIKGCAPWLMLIYNLQRLANVFQYKGSGLEFYLRLFESIVPEEYIRKQKNIVFGNSEELKKQLKESLLKLNRTRNKSDFVYDNEMAITIGSRLIEMSFENKDVEAVLLAMLIKSDYSINFVSKESMDFAPIETQEITHERFYESFDNPIDSLRTLPLEQTDSIIWLINSEDKLFQLSLNNGEFSFDNFEQWDLLKFQSWSDDRVPTLEFDTSGKDRYGSVRSLFIEDFEDQALEIINDISFPPIPNTKGLKNILLVKDMALSELPHNLLLNEENELISLQTSVTNILSVEWLASKINAPIDKVVNNKAIYIPIEGGDLTINMLYESIRESLEKFNVSVFTSLTDFSPIESTINIVSSHGNKDISSTHVFYPNDEKVIHNLNGILGSGKILILLVCHSGSTKELFFRNEMASVIKRYLSSGYEAVIAPYWSLHINIPPLWLPVFFDLINSGANVSDAVFNANKTVFETYPTPAAWACMHLYGNPFFTIPKE